MVSPMHINITLYAHSMPCLWIHFAAKEETNIKTVTMDKQQSQSFKFLGLRDKFLVVLTYINQN